MVSTIVFRLHIDALQLASFVSCYCHQHPSICSSIPRIRHSSMILRISNIFQPVAFLSLIVLIAANEIIILDREYDVQYCYDAIAWGLGQIVAMALVGGQVLEIYTYVFQTSQFGIQRMSGIPVAIGHVHALGDPASRRTLNFPEMSFLRCIYCYDSFIQRECPRRSERLRLMRSAGATSLLSGISGGAYREC